MFILCKTNDYPLWKYRKSQKSKITSDYEAIEEALDIIEKLLKTKKSSTNAVPIA